MRRSGKTTRKVDDAIQKLFMYDSIMIPIVEREGDLRGYDRTNVIFDPDAGRSDVNFSNVQLYIASKIRNRLELEHPNQFKMYESSGSIIFELKNETDK